MSRPPAPWYSRATSANSRLLAPWRTSRDRQPRHIRSSGPVRSTLAAASTRATLPPTLPSAPLQIAQPARADRRSHGHRKNPHAPADRRAALRRRASRSSRPTTRATFPGSRRAGRADGPAPERMAELGLPYEPASFPVEFLAARRHRPGRSGSRVRDRLRPAAPRQGAQANETQEALSDSPRLAPGQAPAAPGRPSGLQPASTYLSDSARAGRPGMQPVPAAPSSARNDTANASPAPGTRSGPAEREFEPGSQRHRDSRDRQRCRRNREAESPQAAEHAAPAPKTSPPAIPRIARLRCHARSAPRQPISSAQVRRGSMLSVMTYTTGIASRSASASAIPARVSCAHRRSDGRPPQYHAERRSAPPRRLRARTVGTGTHARQRLRILEVCPRLRQTVRRPARGTGQVTLELAQLLVDHVATGRPTARQSSPGAALLGQPAGATPRQPVHAPAAPADRLPGARHCTLALEPVRAPGTRCPPAGRRRRPSVHAAVRRRRIRERAPVHHRQQE